MEPKTLEAIATELEIQAYNIRKRLRDPYSPEFDKRHFKDVSASVGKTHKAMNAIIRDQM